MGTHPNPTVPRHVIRDAERVIELADRAADHRLAEHIHDNRGEHAARDRVARLAVDLDREAYLIALDICDTLKAGGITR